MKFLTINFLLVFASLAVAEEIIIGKLCDSYNITNNSTDINQLIGTWYEIAKYGPKEDCSTDDICKINATHYNVVHQNGINSSHNHAYTIRNENGTINSNATTSAIQILNIENGTAYALWSCLNITNTSDSTQSLIILSTNTNYTGYKTVLANMGFDNTTSINHSPEICNVTSYGTLNLASLCIVTLIFFVIQIM
ncbi:uncharacterized protein LOC135133898 [Zophobas morio]|uniref:uncharacterized protein LOC135133898 n=1 Tax=Zophobas morio TaxID=2755281 RepID=UPI003082A728